MFGLRGVGKRSAKKERSSGEPRSGGRFASLFSPGSSRKDKAPNSARRAPNSASNDHATPASTDRDGFVTSIRAPVAANHERTSLTRQRSNCIHSQGQPPPSPAAKLDFQAMPNGELTADPEESSDNVKVLIRIRPPNDLEKEQGYSQYVFRQGGSAISLRQPDETETHKFTFDAVLSETSTQEDVFAVAGLPVVENCISGYNSSVFCYGQTGAGKTYTMQGLHSGAKSEEKGIMPRVFEHVFKRIAEEEVAKGRENLKYSIRCSFLEIYNEQITDLLRPSSTNLHIREDIKHGCYVEGLTEHIVLNSHDMWQLLKKGAENRKVGETRMNRESSRSHSVLTCIIESNTKTSSGMTVTKYSRLNLIDLAGKQGSERNKQSGAVGEQLKEASNINKSLSTLGRVIMNLVQQQQGKSVHVPYRDSRLTFLLQDSLGGNAKTFMIANISPSMSCGGETLSTLRFAQSAKSIVNKAIVNEEAAGDIAELQGVIQRLRNELEAFQNGRSDQLFDLELKISRVEKEKDDLSKRLDRKSSENKNLQQRVSWLEKQAAEADQLRERDDEFQRHVVWCLSLLKQSAQSAFPAQPPLDSLRGTDLLGVASELAERMHQLSASAEKENEALKKIEYLNEAIKQEQALRYDKESALEVNAAANEALLDKHCQLQTQYTSTIEEWQATKNDLTKAEVEVRKLRSELDARVSEIQNLDQMLQSLEDAAQEQEMQLFGEIERLEAEAVNRQNVIANILAAADAFRTPGSIATPFRTPQSSLRKRTSVRSTPVIAQTPTFQQPHRRPIPLNIDDDVENAPLASSKPSPALQESQSPNLQPFRDASNNLKGSANGERHPTGMMPAKTSKAAPQRSESLPDPDLENHASLAYQSGALKRATSNATTLSTCNLLYSNPMPPEEDIVTPSASPKSGPRDDAGGGTSWFNRRSVKAGGSIMGLVRASHVLRQKSRAVRTSSDA